MYHAGHPRRSKLPSLSASLTLGRAGHSHAEPPRPTCCTPEQRPPSRQLSAGALGFSFMLHLHEESGERGATAQLYAQ